MTRIQAAPVVSVVVAALILSVPVVLLILAAIDRFFDLCNKRMDLVVAGGVVVVLACFVIAWRLER